MSFYQKVLAFAQQQCENLNNKDLRNLQTHLSLAYQQHYPTSSLNNFNTAAIYTVTRMPATYHALLKCYQQFPLDFQPHTLLDLGAGPGTASLAALDHWKNTKKITLLENYSHMYEFQNRLWNYLNLSISSQHLFNDIRVWNDPKNLQYDLVVMAYMLGEINSTQREEAVLKAWDKTQNFLLIVTPGTVHDFTYLLEARDLLLRKGGSLLGPCPHHERCPLSRTNDWCHFSVRLTRTSLHKICKKGTLNYEDEKFSYLIFSKSFDSTTIHQARVIRKPIQGSGHIILDVCTKGRINRQIVSKKDSHYKCMSKIKWGDTFKTV